LASGGEKVSSLNVEKKKDPFRREWDRDERVRPRWSIRIKRLALLEGGPCKHRELKRKKQGPSGKGTFGTEVSGL